jgi:hypothetical protein
MFYLLIGIVIAVSFHGHVPRAFRSKIAEARTIWIADAHRDDGKRFVARARKS